MAKLAIRGHETRGKEVMEILEMLGGKHKTFSDGLKWFNGINVHTYYTIEEDNYIHQILDSRKGDYIKFTLEEFLEEFPYKVGDKVTLDKSPCTIKEMSWDCNDIIYYVQGADFSKGVYSKDKDLQPHKEENFAECIENTVQECLFGKEETMEEKLMPRIDLTGYSKNKYIIDLGDYDIKEENGKTYAVRKQLQYPKTYEECCKVLDYCGDYFLTTYDNNGKPSAISNILNSVNVLTKLLICRNAYWKIAGEQMGLGKPWEPDYNEESYEQGSPIKYVIYYTGTHITKGRKCTPSCLLAFPIAEMRDAFYENFEDLIEECKELL